ncbi:MAG TPA: FHA domain-containing protein [Anaerolineae bacterium]|nr:FHA domain-containing protein [Anaerolineae bacterium]
MGSEMIKLQWYDPRLEQQEEQLVTLPITIGRDADNDIVLDSQFVSSQHARLEGDGQHVRLQDTGSKNGILADGQRVLHMTALQDRSRFQVGPFAFTIYLGEAEGDTVTQTEFFHYEALAAALPTTVADDVELFTAATDVITSWPKLAERQVIPDWVVQRQKVPVDRLKREMNVSESRYATIGGGIGSFVWVDHLLVHGAKREDIVVLGLEPVPYERYRQLCKNSQIPEYERLRSNSDSCPDNLWGWPGYGVREIGAELRAGHWRQAGKVAWQLFNEPFVPTYTPRAGAVFAAMAREAARIGWAEMWRYGRVRYIRQTDDGRYVLIYSLEAETEGERYAAVVCDYLHVAVGYGGVRFLPDLQAYRTATGDRRRVVNAYEGHDHIYEHLADNGGIVVIRGRGIVASRVIQRLQEVRLASQKRIQILHLMRETNTAGNRYGSAQREVANHWEFQPFNWPKAAWGGDLRVELEAGGSETRDELLSSWGGTTTADRPDWRQMIADGLAEGWYQIHIGTVDEVVLGENGRLITTLNDAEATIPHQLMLAADFIIDATGLEAGIERHSLLHDLVTHYQLPRNVQGRLAVNPQFELEEMRNGGGRMYASGISTLGGPYAAVDSFLGLQYAALQITEDLIGQGVPDLRSLYGWRSLRGWWRWARGVSI